MKVEDVEVGASEVAAPLGLSPYRTPHAFYAEKVGLTERQPASEAMRLGTHVEHAIVAAYAEQHGLQPRPWEAVRGVERPWLRVTPDRVLLPGDMPRTFSS